MSCTKDSRRDKQQKEENKNRYLVHLSAHCIQLRALQKNAKKTTESDKSVHHCGNVKGTLVRSAQALLKGMGKMLRGERGTWMSYGSLPHRPKSSKRNSN